MTASDVRQILLVSFPDADIKVVGEDSNFSVDIISQEFENITNFHRQKKVLSCVKNHITSGQIHAFSVQVYTQEEWDKNTNSLTVL